MGRGVVWSCMLLGMLAVLAAADSVEVVETAAQADKPSIELEMADGSSQGEEMQAMASLRSIARKLGKCVHLDKKHLVDCGSADSIEPRKHTTHAGSRSSRKARLYSATTQRVNKKHKQRKAVTTEQWLEEADSPDHAEQYGDSSSQQVSAKMMQHKHKDSKHRQYASKTHASGKHHKTASPPTADYSAGLEGSGYRTVKLSSPSTKPRPSAGRHDKGTEQHAEAEVESEQEPDTYTQPDAADADMAEKQDDETHAASSPEEGSLDAAADGAQEAEEEERVAGGNGAHGADILSADYWTVLTSRGAQPQPTDSVV